MEIRLNKLLSDSRLCSRREADKFIEMGRVTVNGQLPEVGQKVTKDDIVMLDDLRVQFKQAQEHARTGTGKTQNLIFGEPAVRTEKKKRRRKRRRKKVFRQKKETFRLRQQTETRKVCQIQ